MMIDSTALILSPSNISEEAYVGPYCIIGFPSTAQVSPLELWLTDGQLTSKGAMIGNKSSLLSHVVVGEESIIGTEVWCDHHTYIGCSTIIGDNAAIMYGARIYDRVKIGKNAWVAGFVCNDVIIEANAIVLGQLVHRFVDAIEGVPEPSPIIREGAFVGMGATIIGGIEVGSGAYIAAGAVLTRTARPGYLYMGAPAREIAKAPSPFKRGG